MFQDYGYLGGMHGGWWMLLVFLGIVAIIWSNGNSSGRGNKRRETPLERLQHRLASGEIKIEEFNAIKGTLETH